MKNLLVIDALQQMAMSAEVLATKIKKMGCRFTIVWANDPSNLLQGIGFVACDKAGVSILIERFENYNFYRPSQQPKPLIAWDGSLEDFLSGICAQDDQNGYSAVISFVRRSHPYTLEAFSFNAILTSNSPFKPLAEYIINQ